MKKALFVAIFLFAVLATTLLILGMERKGSSQKLVESQVAVVHENQKDRRVVVVSEVSQNNPDQSSVASTKVEPIPAQFKLSVPFTSQAPYANWDERHEEACEEASLLMVIYYLQKKSLNKEIAEKEIQGMIDFETKQYGDFRDSTASDIVRLAKEYYGIQNLRVVYDFSQEALKREVAKGNPVIIPAAGRLLGNPNFTAPGPLYHNLVIIGYDGDTIITNDPGTRKGEGYQYQIDVLYDAIHDFPGSKEEIERGRKAMVVVDAS